MDTTIVALDSTTGAMQLQCKPGGKLGPFLAELIWCDVWSFAMLCRVFDICFEVLMIFCGLVFDGRCSLSLKGVHLQSHQFYCCTGLAVGLAVHSQQATGCHQKNSIKWDGPEQCSSLCLRTRKDRKALTTANCANMCQRFKWTSLMNEKDGRFRLAERYSRRLHECNELWKTSWLAPPHVFVMFSPLRCYESLPSTLRNRAGEGL